MDYSSEVRQRFFAPARAGAIAPEAQGVVEGVAEDPSLGVWFRFQVQADSGSIAAVRFRAYGCPQALAAADLVAAELEGKPVKALVGLDLVDLARRIELPRERFGVLLRVEDALRTCHERISAKE